IKILEKGPEYLRKQMELETETKRHLSAVERLAASKPKYVKSQEVVNATPEPVISLTELSVSGLESSDQSSSLIGNVAAGDNSALPAFGAQHRSAGEVRRSSSKKRPDSLLLYRQKCELLRGDRKHHVRHKPLLHSVHKVTDKDCESVEKEKMATLKGPAKECSSSVGRSVEKKSTCHLMIPEIERRFGKGVSRSHSDISSRYSKNFADFDAFFKYCGLSGEVIESLGKENFSARSDEMAIKLRSVSISTSDSGFTRSSGESDGLLEDDLQSKIRQGTSIIERNARIIKWLYSCKNAKEAGKKLRD
uniref:Family with sequence similarity 110 member C n=1 Tax=Tetraodon nigroviridis TaxID=99883 RepID=H3D3W5_TETNG